MENRRGKNNDFLKIINVDSLCVFFCSSRTIEKYETIWSSMFTIFIVLWFKLKHFWELQICLVLALKLLCGIKFYIVNLNELIFCFAKNNIQDSSSETTYERWWCENEWGDDAFSIAMKLTIIRPKCLKCWKKILKGKRMIVSAGTCRVEIFNVEGITTINDGLIDKSMPNNVYV